MIIQRNSFKIGYFLPDGTKNKITNKSNMIRFLIYEYKVL